MLLSKVTEIAERQWGEMTSQESKPFNELHLTYKQRREALLTQLNSKAGSYLEFDPNQQTCRIYLHDSLREFDGTESRLHLLILKFL